MNDENINYNSNEDIIYDVLKDLKQINTSELNFDSKRNLDIAKVRLTEILDYIEEVNDY